MLGVLVALPLVLLIADYPTTASEQAQQNLSYDIPTVPVFGLLLSSFAFTCPQYLLLLGLNAMCDGMLLWRATEAWTARAFPWASNTAVALMVALDYVGTAAALLYLDAYNREQHESKRQLYQMVDGSHRLIFELEMERRKAIAHTQHVRWARRLLQTVVPARPDAPEESRQEQPPSPDAPAVREPPARRWLPLWPRKPDIVQL